MNESDLKIYDSIKDVLELIKSDRDLQIGKLKSFAKSKSEAEEYLICAKEAQTILISEARDTQSEIEEHISKIVTMALAAVEVDDPSVPKPPEFVARMVERRDNTECDLLFKEGDREDYPKESSGYGYQDIADYALRVDFILLEEEYCEEEIRKVLILDEPFRNADSRLQYKISSMLRMVSEELGFQQIIISHAKDVNIEADKTFHVEKVGKISKASVVS